MTFLLDCTIKTSIILGAALSAMPLLRYRSAAMRHCVLSAAILCAAVTPVAVRLLPAWSPPLLRTVRTAPSRPEVRFAGTATATGTERPSLDRPATTVLPWLPGIIWLAGFLLSVGALAVGFVRLQRLAALSERVAGGVWMDTARGISREIGLRRRVVLLQSKNPSILVTWGFLRPRILLPESSGVWPVDRIQAVLHHELAHIARCDWLMQTLAEMLRACCWFNPLLWIACTRLRLESEYACDDAALTRGMPSSRYAAHLLDVVRALQQTDHAWSAALAMARPSTVERRFTAMLKPGIHRSPVTRRALVAITFAAVCITLPLAAVHSSAAPAEQVAVGGISGIVRSTASEKIGGTAEVASAPQPRTAGTSKMTQVEAQGAPAAEPAKQYKGELISLDVKDLDIRELFKLIGQISGKSVVMGPSVRDTVTLKLKDVPWDQAVDEVAATSHLRITETGNVLRIEKNGMEADDTITLNVELYKNEILLGHPIITVLNHGTAQGRVSLAGDAGFTVKLMGTLKTPDQTNMLVEITTSDDAKTVFFVPLSDGMPGQFQWKSGTDTFEIRLTVAPR